MAKIKGRRARSQRFSAEKCVFLGKFAISDPRGHVKSRQAPAAKRPRRASRRGAEVAFSHSANQPAIRLPHSRNTPPHRHRLKSLGSRKSFAEFTFAPSCRWLDIPPLGGRLDASAAKVPHFRRME